MDWFSWLSKTNLEPTLVYEYGLTFSHNELEAEDIVYFNHEFLQSMGISIAKHRLEILKLAKNKNKSKRPSPHSISKLMVAIKKTKRCLANYIKSMTICEESNSALVVVPMPLSSSYSSSSRSWKSAVMKRNNKKLLKRNKQERLLLTNGSPSVHNNNTNSIVPSAFAYDGFSSPMVYHFHEGKKIERDNDDDDDDDAGYWSSAVEDIRWDTMFQDLKPN